uniref:Uncharacterized protein n=1 Tax=Arundo donax TaxID=35708 RepID=A0A0A9B435_ARUDO
MQFLTMGMDFGWGIRLVTVDCRFCRMGFRLD